MNTQRRIDVMHFASQLIRGGAEEHMLTLLTHLDRGGFDRCWRRRPSHRIAPARPASRYRCDSGHSGNYWLSGLRMGFHTHAR